MLSEYVERIGAYIRKVEDEWKSGRATEHTYRPMLKELVEALMTRITVVNEPKHIECGAPDYLLRRGADILGFIEAKDIGDGDLDGRTVNKEQFNRYKDSLDNLCFTDYLDFHFYDHGDFVDSVRIAEPKGDRIVTADDAELERFLQLLERFADAKPQHITSPSRLARLMAGKARLLADGVRRYLGREENADSMLAQQMEAFRNVLIHDIDADSFADIFAQTVTYGMFAARLHDSTPEDFSRAEAATLIPKTNPLLRQMFQYIAMDTDDSIEWIVDDLVSLFAAVDVEKLMRGYGRDTQKSDPLLHFYEDFLAAYDPKLRKSRGVWYTPKPVVDFIVRSVDRILERDFSLPGGLAENTKVKIEVNNDTYSKNSRAHEKKRIGKEIHRVQILDPAAGTGTFLAETVKLIHSKVAEAMGEGAWQGYVAESLLPRLNGFEILMASYAMAHLKLDMLLAETGYEHKTNERLRVFLTNSLEPYDKETGTLFAAALSQEANEANFVKRDCPVMVVIGNPPYSGVSSNNGEWAAHLVDDYKKEPNSDLPLQERKHWLNDDYVKFLSFAQHYIDKNGEGVVGFINNNGFLDNPTFRGMRWSLLKSFDEIYILNLHGDAKKKETGPDGSKDENVFDIMQGVSINIFVKHNGAAGVRALPRDSLATVHYADVYGLRDAKYAFLDANGVESVKWQTLDLRDPYYFFVPKDFGLQKKYEEGFPIAELMHEQSMGAVSANDDLNVSITEHEQRDKINDLLMLQEDDWRQKTGRKKDSRDWTYATAHADAVEHSESIKKISYRPFDNRFTCYTGKSRGLYSSPQKKIMSHFLHGENLGLCALRICSRDDSLPVFVTDKITDKTILSSKDNATVFPLYLYNDNMGKVEKVPNFDKAIYEKICAAVNGSKEGYFAAGELSRNWFDIVDPALILAMPTIDIGRPRQLIDRKAVKAAFKDFGVIENVADGSRVVFPAASAGKMLYQSGVDIRGMAAAFKMLFETSLRAWNEREVPMEGHKFHFNVGAYRNYINRFSFDGAEYFVRFTIREIGADSSVHASTISEVALYKNPEGAGSDSHPENPEDGHTTPFIDNKIAFYFTAVNGVSAVTPEDVFNYIYGVLHTPSYREKYKEFLKIDFPRIPYPQSAAEFRRVAEVGEKLVRVHLLKDESVANPFANPYAKFEGSGDGLVEKVVFEAGRVYINDGQWFEPVPEEAWNFYIGGYQPAQKWLKDRKGRSLTSEDQLHYRAIIAALMKTSELMGTLKRE